MRINENYVTESELCPRDYYNKRQREIDRENRATLAYGEIDDKMSAEFMKDCFFRKVPGSHHWAESVGDYTYVCSIDEDNYAQARFSTYNDNREELNHKRVYLNGDCVEQFYDYISEEMDRLEESASVKSKRKIEEDCNGLYEYLRRSFWGSGEFRACNSAEDVANLIFARGMDSGYTDEEVYDAARWFYDDLNESVNSNKGKAIKEGVTSERHIKGKEDSAGVNPFYYFASSLDKGDKTLIFDNLGYEHELDESMFPKVEFHQLRSGLWDVRFSAPAFDRTETEPRIVNRNIKGLSKKAACVIYAMLVCGHGDTDDSHKAAYHFRKGNLAALKMVPNALYTSGFGIEAWMADWDRIIDWNWPTYNKWLGWCGDFTKLRTLLLNLKDSSLREAKEKSLKAQVYDRLVDYLSEMGSPDYPFRKAKFRELFNNWINENKDKFEKICQFQNVQDIADDLYFIFNKEGINSKCFDF